MANPISVDPQPSYRDGPPGAATVGVGRLDAMSAVLARNWWLIALRGVFAILFGVVAFAAPGAFVLSLVVLFAAYMMVDGIFGVIASVRAAQAHERWGFLLLEGILNVVVGVAAFLVPAAAVWTFVVLIGGWALVTGGLMIAAAFRLHAHYGRGWLGLGGLVSILFGLSLLINPGISILLLTWWAGAYALAFGVMLLVLSVRLRSRHVTGA